MEEKVYKIEIDPAILKLLGPSLYTNIYYVLAELIANAWDADAHNVYIIDKSDVIIVEDDGKGMSYSLGGINKYLNVAHETRLSVEDSKTTELSRVKMGRKGIGKLSSLAVSKNVSVMTIANNEKSGFILSREVPPNGKLTAIPDEEIIFSKISDHGTSIVMSNPEYKLNKGIDVIKKNLIKMFPVISKDFRIHIFKGTKSAILNEFDTNIIKDLATLITIGEEYSNLIEHFTPGVSERINELFSQRTAKSIPLKLVNKNGVENQYSLIIKGWIGAYKTTKGKKTEVLEFQDNFISLYSNGKMGEFNILPRIGQNKLPEVYVVGQLHVDLFEETSLPDMALSNRQGYKDDDERYIKTTEFARELLNDIIKLRTTWSLIKKKNDNLKEMDLYKTRESLFKQNILSYQDNVSQDVANALSKEKNIGKSSQQLVETLVKESLEKHKNLLGLKPLLDKEKKKILISQTSKDKDLSDVIYELLLFNGVPKKEIIFTNSDDEVSRIPEGYDIYKYLRDFFVDSISDQKMYVVYVTSIDMGKSWGAIVEVGANWITQMNHKIFNINDFHPGIPLNIQTEWQQSYRNSDNNIEMDRVNLDKFCVKIESICSDLGYSPRTREENKTKLKELVIEC